MDGLGLSDREREWLLAMPAWSDGTCGADIERKLDEAARTISFLEKTGCWRFVDEARRRVQRAMDADRLRS